MNKDIWLFEEQAYFEYHCWQSHESGDAALWYRSQQVVIVLKVTDQCVQIAELNTFNKRMDAGEPLLYDIKFADGFKGSAFEDELLTSPQDYHSEFRPGIVKVKELSS